MSCVSILIIGVGEGEGISRGRGIYILHLELVCLLLEFRTVLAFICWQQVNVRKRLKIEKAKNVQSLEWVTETYFEIL